MSKRQYHKYIYGLGRIISIHIHKDGIYCYERKELYCKRLFNPNNLTEYINWIKQKCPNVKIGCNKCNYIQKCSEMNKLTNNFLIDKKYKNMKKVKKKD